MNLLEMNTLREIRTNTEFKRTVMSHMLDFMHVYNIYDSNNRIDLLSSCIQKENVQDAILRKVENKEEISKYVYLKVENYYPLFLNAEEVYRVVTRDIQEEEFLKLLHKYSPYLFEELLSIFELPEEEL